MQDLQKIFLVVRHNPFRPPVTAFKQVVLQKPQRSFVTRNIILAQLKLCSSEFDQCIKYQWFSSESHLGSQGRNYQVLGENLQKE